MARYRKRPVEIEAIKWTGNNFNEIKEFAGENVKMLSTNELAVITLEDGMFEKPIHIASIGDYIIKGVEGEFYFCKPNIFEKTYEIVMWG